MKEPSKRIISGIPIVGTVFLLWAGREEYAEYEQWLENNSGETIEEYAVYKKEFFSSEGRLLKKTYYAIKIAQFPHPTFSIKVDLTLQDQKTYIA